MTRYSAVEAPNQFVACAGRRLAYRSIGVGKPLVLCVRFRGNMDDWDPAFLDALAAEGLRVVTFDYSGLGLSTGPRSYDPVALGRDANDLIDELDLVVSFTTSVLVFAGAVATPAIGLCFDRDWKFLGQDHDPWFPTETDLMRGRFEDWSAVLARAADLVRERFAL